MKYFALLVFLILVSLLMVEFVFKDRAAEGFTSLWQKLRDLGSRFHLAMGVAAVFIVLYFVVRFLVIALKGS